MDRKGVFFTVDAIIALTVLAVGAAILLMMFSGSSVQDQTSLYASDLMAFFRNTKVQDVKEDWLINMWCVQGPRCTNATHNLSRGDQSLLAASAQLIKEGKNPTAGYIMSRVSEGLVQPQFGWNLTLTTPQGVKTGLAQKERETQDDYIVEKALVYVTIDHALEGPYVAELAVWQ